MSFDLSLLTFFCVICNRKVEDDMLWPAKADRFRIGFSSKGTVCQEAHWISGTLATLSVAFHPQNPDWIGTAPAHDPFYISFRVVLQSLAMPLHGFRKSSEVHPRRDQIWWDKVTKYLPWKLCGLGDGVAATSWLKTSMSQSLLRNTTSRPLHRTQLSKPPAYSSFSRSSSFIISLLYYRSIQPLRWRFVIASYTMFLVVRSCKVWMLTSPKKQNSSKCWTAICRGRFSATSADGYTFWLLNLDARWG